MAVVSPSPSGFVRRTVHFAMRLLFAAVLIAGGGAIGIRWGPEWPFLRGLLLPPSTAHPTGSTPASAEALLRMLDARLQELQMQIAAAERDEKESEIARNLLLGDGLAKESPVVAEQEQARIRAGERKASLLAEHVEYRQLRAELLEAKATGPPPADSDLGVRVRMFILHQDLNSESKSRP